MALIAGLAGLFLLPSPWNVVAVTAAALVEVGEVAFWLRFLRRYRIQTGAEGMIGARAEVIEATSPERGRVRVYGEVWSARSRATLGPGESVRIASVDGLTLEVEPDQGTEKGP